MSELTISAHERSYRIADPGGLIGKALRAGNPYEAPVLEHIYGRGFEGLAVDVGASVGNHTLWLAAVCDLAVVAIEPLDHPRLARNLALNDLNGQVELWPFALGDEPEEAYVTGPPAHVVGEELYPEDGVVDVHRLDSFDLTDVALIKIDVEGMEPQVLRGAEETIRRERPVIYAEAQDEAAHERNAEILVEYGYEHRQTFGATPLEEWDPV